ncbi:MAG TPA: VOC family protein [Cyclobacteriaceae bacterium]|nr:VOC family protein [Cyclobacteriaceae bacterium]
MKNRFFLSGMLSLLMFASAAQSTLRSMGVKVNVTDMRKAITFYRDVLAFQLESGDERSEMVVLKPGTGDERIVLHLVSYVLPAKETEAAASFTLQVNNLDDAIVALKSKGVNFGSYVKRKEGVGYAIYFDDPFQTRISMMHETVQNNPEFKEPRLYNFGFLVPDMTAARDFFVSKLGFVVRSEKYLPLDLPLGHADKTFAFMIHYREGVEPIHYNAPDNQHVVVMFQTDSLDLAVRGLKDRGVVFTGGVVNGPLGREISFYDPFGYLSQLVERK